MNNPKTDISSAIKQYNALDPASQGIVMAILQLAAALFTGIQQIQNINNQQEKDA